MNTTSSGIQQNSCRPRAIQIGRKKEEEKKNNHMVDRRENVQLKSTMNHSGPKKEKR